MSEYEGTMRWFGARFDTPMYAHMPEVPAPLGEVCGLCGESIQEGEPGITMPALEKGGAPNEFLPIRMAIHIECNLRSVWGSLAHLDGQCSCHTEVQYVSGKTWRQEALEVIERMWGTEWRSRALAPGALTLEERVP